VAKDILTFIEKVRKLGIIDHQVIDKKEAVEMALPFCTGKDF
jgi:surfactin synthase thioesterase subunit